MKREEGGGEAVNHLRSGLNDGSLAAVPLTGGPP